MNYHEIKDYVIGTLAICSTLHSILPPWDWRAEFLNDFPKAQGIVFRLVHNRWYKLLVYVTGFIAINMRSTLWRSSISMPVQIERMQANGKL